MSAIARLFVALAMTVSLAACGDGGPDAGGGGDASYPGTEAGAKALLDQFYNAAADQAALSASLRPTAEDFAAIFEGDAAAKAETGYKEPWDKGLIRIAPKSAQTEVLLWAASSEDLKAGSGNAREFPGGYSRVAKHLKPGITLYRFKFVEPGKTLGMAYDGLVHVNGRWVIVPKPWRVLQ